MVSHYCCTHKKSPLNFTIYWENSKGPLPKFLNPNTYGGFLVMYIWLTAPTFSPDDWRLEVVWSFIDDLTLMVGDWYNLFSFDIMSYFGGWFDFYWIPFDGVFIVELIWFFTYPSEAFQMVCHCLPYSPFQWPFSP